MSLENGKVTSEQVKLPEYLEQPRLKDLVPGAVVYIYSDQLRVDDDGYCWLVGNTQVQSDAEWQCDYKVVRINEGYVIDIFKRNQATEIQKLDEETGDGSLPVVGFIRTSQELLDFDDQFKIQTGQRYLNKKTRKELKQRTKKAAAKIEKLRLAAEAAPTQQNKSKRKGK